MTGGRFDASIKPTVSVRKGAHACVGMWVAITTAVHSTLCRETCVISSIGFTNTSAIFASAARSPVAASQAYLADGSGAPANNAMNGGVTAVTSDSANRVTTYDFTHMTPSQMQGAAQDLRKAGKIDLTQELMLQTAGMPLGRMGADGQFIPLSGTERAAFSDTPVDYIQKAQGAIGFLEQSGGAADPTSGYASWKGLLATMQDLQGQTSGVNITA